MSDPQTVRRKPVPWGCLAIVGMAAAGFFGYLLPAVQSARNAARSSVVT